MRKRGQEEIKHADRSALHLPTQTDVNRRRTLGSATELRVSVREWASVPRADQVGHGPSIGGYAGAEWVSIGFP